MYRAASKRFLRLDFPVSPGREREREKLEAISESELAHFVRLVLSEPIGTIRRCERGRVWALIEQRVVQVSKR